MSSPLSILTLLVACNGDDVEPDDTHSGETGTTGTPQDNDGDTYFDCSETLDWAYGQLCGDKPADCDDNNASMFPGASEYCDGEDNNCDGNVDEESAVDVTEWCADNDGDSFGDAAVTQWSCESPNGYVDNPDDCDDSDATINPDQSEVPYNGVNDDCDESTIDDDFDGDGYPTTSSGDEAVSGLDCDDNDPNINPSATEECDGVDNNCDTQIDEGVTATFYADVDGDGYGDESDSSEACSATGNYTATDSTDCDDDDATVNPSGYDVCGDGADQDCSGIDETCVVTETDADGDGDDDVAFGGGDCDDTDSAVNSFATELCDSVDNDCDGTVDEDDAADAATWFADSDSDGYGDSSSTTDACTQPSGYTSDSTDCDDSNPSTNPATTETVYNSVDDDCDTSTLDDDLDSDGYNLADDCDDEDAAISPAGYDVCEDGVDQDCSGTDETCVVTATDADGDGHDAIADGGDDCDDTVAAVNPGATEICDGIDNDCDGDTDDDDSSVADPATWYADGDGDGYYDLNNTALACEATGVYTSDVAPTTDADCDDGDASVYQTATIYSDGDSDGFTSSSTTECIGTSAPAGYSLSASSSTDCDDADSSVNPGATETCNSTDDDCDGTTDEDVTTTYYADGDGDGYGTSDTTDEACAQPTGFVTDATDCDDTTAAVNPAATEECNGEDDDCNGLADDDDSGLDLTTAVTWYEDDDGDTYGDATSTPVQFCEQPTGYVADATDCDDADSSVSPAASESCNSVDDDCDGSTDDGLATTTLYRDSDSDGYGASTSTTTSCYTSVSGYVTDSSDCDDATSSVNPGATETCNSTDDDCDGSTDEGVTTTYYADADGDGYGDESSTDEACSAASGYVAATSDFDCDDTEATTNPGESEVCDDGVDNDCSGDAPECVLSDISLSSADLRFRTTVNEAALGSAIAGAGDLDADGYDDYLIAGPDLSLTTAGKVNVAYGAADGYDTAYALTGDSTGDLAGYDVAGGCDWDADGTPDIAVSSPYDDDGGTNAGAVYLVEGPVTSASTLGSVAVSKFTGESDEDYAGSAIGMGDFDNNGNCDVLIGANSYAHSGIYNAYGAAYIVNGPTSTTSISAADAFIEGSSVYDQAGLAVATGDIDGDGNVDFVVGAPQNRDNGSIADPWNSLNQAGAGKASLFLGPVSGAFTLDDGDAIILGEAAGDRLGYGLAMNGDVDNDGYNDLLIGSFYESSVATTNGAAYLLYGPLSGSVDLSSTSADAKITGEYQGQFVGGKVAFVDTNNDNYSDLIITATGGAASSSTLTAGAAYLFYGDIVGAYDISDFDAALTGENADDNAGDDISGIGDANGDGFDDIMIGATGYDYTGTNNGVAYGIFGTGM